MSDYLATRHVPRAQSTGHIGGSSSAVSGMPNLRRRRSDTFEEIEYQDERIHDSLAQVQSKYDEVYVLLVCWEKDNLGVEIEIEMLHELFTNEFDFLVQSWKIPFQHRPGDALADKLNELRSIPGPNDLVILYYGGHAGDSRDGTCVWAPFLDSPYTLDWNSMASLLTQEDFDVLFILDCCHAATAVGAFGGAVPKKGANWLLASSGTDREAEGVSRKSFTQRMIIELDDMVSGFRGREGRRFTSEDLHTNLHLNHWHKLKTNPVYVRLNRQPCHQIDIAPLVFFDQSIADEGWDVGGYGPGLSTDTPSEIDELRLPASITNTEGSIDVILVPGGNGDPFSSFRARSARSLWPQSVLCPEIETRLRLHTRLLSFKYPWGDIGYHLPSFRQASEALVNEIYRCCVNQHSQRPLLFVAYGRGCTLVRSAIHILFGSSAGYRMKPKIGAIFCGTNRKWENLYMSKIRPTYAPTKETLIECTLNIDRRLLRASEVAHAQRPSRESSRERRSSSVEERRRLSSDGRRGRRSSSAGGFGFREGHMNQPGIAAVNPFGGPPLEFAGFRPPSRTRPRSRDRDNRREINTRPSPFDLGGEAWEPRGRTRGRTNEQRDRPVVGYVEFFEELNTAMMHSVSRNGLGTRLYLMMGSLRGLVRAGAGQHYYKARGERNNYAWTTYGPWQPDA